MTDKQIIKLNELTEMSQELGLYECDFKGECQIMNCINDENCFIKELFKELAYIDCARIEVIAERNKYKEVLDKIYWELELLNDRRMVRKDICDRLDKMLTMVMEVLDD